MSDFRVMKTTTNYLLNVFIFVIFCNVSRLRHARILVVVRMLIWVTKTCIHNVQFVQFLTTYLATVIHFVEFQGRPADRKPHFVAVRIVRRVMSLALQLRQQNSLIPFQLEDDCFCFLKLEGTNALLPLFHQISHYSRVFIDRTCSHSRFRHQASICHTYRLTC